MAFCSRFRDMLIGLKSGLEMIYFHQDITSDYNTKPDGSQALSSSPPISMVMHGEAHSIIDFLS